MMRVPAGRVARCVRRLRDAGCAVSAQELAAHFLAGGEIENVTAGLVEARRLGIGFAWPRACAIDLATRHSPSDPVRLLELVRAAHESSPTILPANGAFEVCAAGRPTWRPRVRIQTIVNLDRYVGGGDLSALEARVKSALAEAYADSRNAVDAAHAFLALEHAHLADGTRFLVKAVELLE